MLLLQAVGFILRSDMTQELVSPPVEDLLAAMVVLNVGAYFLLQHKGTVLR